MMRTFIVSFVLLFSCSQVFAQSSTSYDYAIGIKFPGGFAVSYKQFVKDYQNIEAEVMFWKNGSRAVGLYEFNWDISGIDGLRWYAGPGLHLGARNDIASEKSSAGFGFGIDGVIGLDYKLTDLPLNISLDWQPGVDLIGTSGYGAAYGGIGVRYTF